MKNTNGLLLFNPYKPRDFYEIERSALKKIDELKKEIDKVSNSKKLNAIERLIMLDELGKHLRAQEDLVRNVREVANRFGSQSYFQHRRN